MSPEIRFTDLTVMPFGEHRGKKLGDVPASWLLWFDGEKEKQFRLAPGSFSPLERALLTYIENNRKALEGESSGS